MSKRSDTTLLRSLPTPERESPEGQNAKDAHPLAQCSTPLRRARTPLPNRSAKPLRNVESGLSNCGRGYSFFVGAPLHQFLGHVDSGKLPLPFFEA
jgi:hypothetical protein